jgi:acyl-coenzyme A thioesterase PaaI-like protein
MQNLDRQDILGRVRQAIGLNRQVGFTFLGHLLRLPTDLAGTPKQTEIEALPHCSDENGELDPISFGIFIDVGLSRSIRGSVEYYGRMATANINVTLRGGSRRGRLKTTNVNFMGYFAGSEARQVQTQIEFSGPDGPLGMATGLFVMDLSAPPVTPKKFPDNPPPLPLDELDAGEQELYRHAEASLDRAAADGRAFPSHFWGVETQQTADGAVASIFNGRQFTNRSGHMQGGAQLGTVLRTADAALGEEWTMTGVNATYMRPGITQHLKAVSSIVYRGRLTALVATRILDADDRLILQASSTHAKRGQN